MTYLEIKGQEYFLYYLRNEAGHAWKLQKYIQEKKRNKKRTFISISEQYPPVTIKSCTFTGSANLM